MLSILNFSILALILMPNSAMAKKAKAIAQTPAGFVLYYQPLFEFPQTQAQSYIHEIQTIIAHNNSMDLEKILATEGKEKACKKPKGLACTEALYPKAKCVPRNKIPSQHCAKTSGKHSTEFFSEPVFSRIQWNKMAIQLNTYCLNSKNPVCVSLNKHQDQYMNKYSHLIRTQREHRKKEMKNSQ